jgi:hypothetical protein
MILHRIVLLVALAVAVQAAPLTWTLSNAVFGDGGTAVGSFVYDASTVAVVSYSIQTSAGADPNFSGFLYQNGAPNDTGVIVYSGLDMIDFTTNFANSHGTNLQLRLAPLAGLTNAGGVVSFDFTNVYLGECYNCSPFRQFASGQMVSAVSAGVPEPATALLVLIPLACGVLVRRRLSGRR